MLRRVTAFALPLIAASALVAPAGAATSFNYPDFASTAGLTLSAGAIQEGSLLRLTPAAAQKSGRVFRTEPIDPQQSFKTSFAISMHDSTCCNVPTLKPADGMAFLLQNKGPTAGEGTGGSLGYGGIAPSLAVEFDIYTNAGDPATDHVAIVTDGNTITHLQCANASGPAPPCSGSLPFPLYGAPVYAWVEYDAGSQHLKVFVSQSNAKPAAPVLDAQVSMAPLGSVAYAGFTAATGSHNALQDVLSWEFNPPEAVVPPPVADPAKKTPKCPKRKSKGKKGQGKKAGASQSKGKAKGKGKGKKCGKKKGKKKGQGAK
jgi:hypothetical protein